ncbi:hypothetical protein EV122DRAFT_285459 [Schizophyllum commune]
MFPIINPSETDLSASFDAVRDKLYNVLQIARHPAGTTDNHPSFPAGRHVDAAEDSMRPLPQSSDSRWAGLGRGPPRSDTEICDAGLEVWAATGHGVGPLAKYKGTPLLVRIDLLTQPTSDRLSFYTHHQSTPNALIAFYAAQAITSTTMTRAGHTLTTDHPGVSLDSRTLLSAQKARDQRVRRSKAPPDIPRELHPFLSLSVGPSTMSNAVSRALSYDRSTLLGQ